LTHKKYFSTLKRNSLFHLFTAVAAVNVPHPHESEKEFEEEFNKHYNNAKDEEKASEALEHAEEEVLHDCFYVSYG